MKFVFILLITLFLLSGCSQKKSENDNKTIVNESYSINRVSVDSISAKPHEEDIASFSTNILYKDENRQNNMIICCSDLNGYAVKRGEIFSFCNVLGSATPEDGYKKAEVFESDGDIIKQYGGGKCQVSSTLYNAILQVPSLVVTERHAHSRKVSYVESGKDAAVAYGSVDFKFKNDYDYDIKIYASCNENTVDIKLVKIVY